MTSDCCIQTHPLANNMQPTMTTIVSSNDTSEQFVSLLKKPTRTAKQDGTGHQMTRRQTSSSVGAMDRAHGSLTGKLKYKSRAHVVASVAVAEVTTTTTTSAIEITSVSEAGDEHTNGSPNEACAGDNQHPVGESKADPHLDNRDELQSIQKTKPKARIKNSTREAKQQRKSQKPRRRVATMAQRRAANIRERRRMFNLNSAFDKLRKKVPSFAYEKRLSRIETLKLAIMYIKFMDNLVNDDDYIEKYKQLTANCSNGLGPPSGYLSSGSFLSLYGQQSTAGPDRVNALIGNDAQNQINQTSNFTSEVGLRFGKSLTRLGGNRKNFITNRHLLQSPPTTSFDCLPTNSCRNPGAACSKGMCATNGAESQQYRIKQSSASPSNINSCCPSTSPPNSTASATNTSCRSSSINFGATSSDCCSPASASPSSSGGLPRHPTGGSGSASYSRNLYYKSQQNQIQERPGHVFNQQQHYDSRGAVDQQSTYFDATAANESTNRLQPTGVTTYYNLQPKFLAKQHQYLQQQPQHPTSKVQSDRQSSEHSRAAAVQPSSQFFPPNTIDQFSFPANEINQTSNHYEPYSQHQPSHHHLSSLGSAHHSPVVGYPINSQLQAR